ncbi:hypothetical protein VZQ01_27275 [Myxococcus faecalis]|uniref:hypothetical protein n=1 Tax=Myxococcus faecalis TaxID=3115646 RepID=UPI0024C92662|nr:hypothetical protein MFMH1_70050 [Myxococcus sp. MH1]
MPIRLVIRVKNQLERATWLTVEPWGEVKELAPKAHVNIQAQGPGPDEAPDGGLVEVQMTPDGIKVWGWSGSDLEIVEPAPK